MKERDSGGCQGDALWFVCGINKVWNEKRSAALYWVKDRRWGLNDEEIGIDQHWSADHFTDPFMAESSVTSDLCAPVWFKMKIQLTEAVSDVTPVLVSDWF